MKNLAKIVTFAILVMSAVVFVGCDSGEDCNAGESHVHAPTESEEYISVESEMHIPNVEGRSSVRAVVIEHLQWSLMVEVRDESFRSENYGIEKFWIGGGDNYQLPVFFAPEYPNGELIPATIDDLTIDTYVRIYPADEWRSANPPGNSPLLITIEQN